MEALKITARVGQDGLLKLSLPIGIVNSDLEVMIVYEVKPEQPEVSWEEFVKATYGALAHDPIERGDQGVFEVREELL